MDIKSIINSPLLGLVKFFEPKAAPVIDFVRGHQDVIVDVLPMLQAAKNEGGSVLAAAEEHAPQFIAAFKDFISKHKPAGINAANPAPVKLESLVRQAVGLPGLTSEEEKAWMDRATPGNDPSQENSKFPVG